MQMNWWADCVAGEGGYKKWDRQQKEQFINELYDDNMVIEIIKELIAVMTWAQWWGSKF